MLIRQLPFKYEYIPFYESMVNIFLNFIYGHYDIILIEF